MKKFLSVLLLILFPSIVSGLTYNSELTEFGYYKDVRLKISDLVNGGCWTNLKEVREYSEEKIKNSGMTLNDDGSHKFTFLIQSIGRRSDGLCGGQITVGLYTSVPIIDDVVGLVTVKEVGITIRGVSFNNHVMDMIGLFFKK